MTSLDLKQSAASFVTEVSHFLHAVSLFYTKLGIAQIIMELKGI